MRKYNVEELRDKLERCRNVNLDDVKLEDVDEISSISIDRRKPSEERILDFIVATKNPYAFKVNDALVKISFSDNERKAETAIRNVLKSLYR